MLIGHRFFFGNLLKQPRVNNQRKYKRQNCFKNRIGYNLNIYDIKIQIEKDKRNQYGNQGA